MFKLPSSPLSASKSCTPHLLPCSIHHNGPVDAKPRYWDPAIGEDGQLEAYFRGRKLKGREVKVPGGYTGSICSQANKGSEAGKETTKGREGNGEELEVDKDEEDSGEEGEAQELEEVASFDKIVLWGHESLVEGDDPFVKGVEEWIGFAEAMHKPGKVDGA